MPMGGWGAGTWLEASRCPETGSAPSAGVDMEGFAFFGGGACFAISYFSLARPGVRAWNAYLPACPLAVRKCGARFLLTSRVSGAGSFFCRTFLPSPSFWRSRVQVFQGASGVRACARMIGRCAGETKGRREDWENVGIYSGSGRGETPSLSHSGGREIGSLNKGAV